MAGRAGPPFGPDAVTWRVNLEPVTLLGASRALLMQVAHPLVAAGVAQHSDYISDPWSRLFSTLDVMFKLAFGSPETSARQAKRLQRTHARVRGVSPEGQPYDAQDPNLMWWVLATLFDTSILLYERGCRPLTPIERERYYQEGRAAATVLGIAGEAVPPTHEDFQRYMDRMMRQELRVTPEARQVARSVVTIPRPSILGPAIGGTNRLFAAALLPEKLRRDYGFEWSGHDERRVRRLLAVARATTRLAPRRVRTFPVRVLVERDLPAIASRYRRRAWFANPRRGA